MLNFQEFHRKCKTRRRHQLLVGYAYVVGSCRLSLLMSLTQALKAGSCRCLWLTGSTHTFTTLSSTPLQYYNTSNRKHITIQTKTKRNKNKDWYLLFDTLHKQLMAKKYTKHNESLYLSCSFQDNMTQFSWGAANLDEKKSAPGQVCGQNPQGRHCSAYRTVHNALIYAYIHYSTNTKYYMYINLFSTFWFVSFNVLFHLSTLLILLPALLSDASRSGQLEKVVLCQPRPIISFQ